MARRRRHLTGARGANIRRLFSRGGRAESRGTIGNRMICRACYSEKRMIGVFPNRGGWVVARASDVRRMTGEVRTCVRRQQSGIRREQAKYQAKEQADIRRRLRLFA